MRNDSGPRPAVPLECNTAFEQELADTLVLTLPSSWTLQHQAPPLDVQAPDLDFQYTPDMVVRNESTGQSLSVEVKNSVSLSLPNIMKFRRIQSAIEQSGGDFLLVVHGETPGAGGAKRWLSEYGINAVGASRAEEAAGMIAKQLTLPGPNATSLLSDELTSKVLTRK
jgi:hypothetical protein